MISKFTTFFQTSVRYHRSTHRTGFGIIGQKPLLDTNFVKGVSTWSCIIKIRRHQTNRTCHNSCKSKIKPFLVSFFIVKGKNLHILR